MNGPCVLLDLNPIWAALEQGYVGTPARLIGPFYEYCELLATVYKAMHNDSGDDDVLIDHYLNGTYVQLTDQQQEAARAGVLVGLDQVLLLGDIEGTRQAGKIRAMQFNIAYRTLFIEYGGDHDQA